MMRYVVETFGGLWELLLLGLRSRFRFRGPYWRWRFETAFGSDPSAFPARWQRVRAMLAYGRWIYRIKRATGK